MIKITYQSADGTQTVVDANEGDTVMQTALANDVDGIVGECGGSMMCATCHCYAPEGTGERMDGEEEMLECAVSEVRPNSRLSCQITLTSDMDGKVFELPEEQV